MITPTYTYTYKPKPFLTEKIFRAEIESDLNLLKSEVGVNTYKEAIKKKYTIGKYVIDLFMYEFESKLREFEPIDDELPYERWGWN